jgi:hypothetical protein
MAFRAEIGSSVVGGFPDVVVEARILARKAD